MRKQERGRKFEDRIAKKGGGKKVPLSGAGVKKHDVEEGPWLIEAKSTSKGSYSVSAKLLNELRRNAMTTGKLPRLDIQFFNGTSTPIHAVVLFKDIFDHIQENQDNGQED